ncbi:hypothetical protein [Burkholderia gladioli]|uniref:hypothetical protein n=1 Tax=Burkholderia gladioli TaxID=28095 RepID=UPI00164028F2|nr:hypothetical protein [Burkholderia gladioli]
MACTVAMSPACDAKIATLAKHSRKTLGNMPLSWKGITTATFQASASIARAAEIIGTGQSATRSNRTATLPGTARRMLRRPAGRQFGSCICPRCLLHETIERGERSHAFIFEASESAALTFIKRGHGSDRPSKNHGAARIARRRRRRRAASPARATRLR